MNHVNQRGTSSSSPVITTAITANLQPCKDDTDIVAVSVEPRIWSDGGGNTVSRQLLFSLTQRSQHR